MDQNDIPKVHKGFQNGWERDRRTLFHAYQTHQHSFVPNLLPEQAVQMTSGDTLNILRQRLGLAFHLTL